MFPDGIAEHAYHWTLIVHQCYYIYRMVFTNKTRDTISLKSMSCLILLIFHRFYVDSREGCYHPGLPINGETFPDKLEFLKGDELTFTCSQSYVLFGESKIQCLGNKSWSGNVPFCEKNDAFGLLPQCLRKEGVINETLTNVVTDGNLLTCQEITVDKEMKLTIWFEKKSNLSDIYVYFKKFSKAQMKTNVILVATNGYPYDYIKSTCHPTNEGLEIDLTIFKCNQSQYLWLSEIMQLIFISPVKTNIEICDIMSFSVEVTDVQFGSIRNEFNCGESRCIPLSRLCDGILHSWDGEDETKANCNNSAALIMATENDIRITSMETGNDTIIVKNQNSFKMNYLYSAGILVWIDHETRHIKRASMSEGSPIVDIITDDIMSPEDIAVDWIYSHIYWTDKGKKTVEVADLSKNMRKILITDNIDTPKAIVLNPIEGWMFWNDWGASKIERCGMDGTHRKSIIERATCTSLAIDLSQQRLYWEDLSETLNSANFDGGERKLFLTVSSHNHLYSSIDIQQDWIYWNEMGIILKANKISGKNVTKVIDKKPHLRNFQVYHSSKQPTGRNYCAPNNGNCSHFCLPSPRITDQSPGFSCSCLKHFKLSDDARTCISSQYSKCNLSREFDCGNSICIPFSQVCDQTNHCSSGADEFYCGSGALLIANTFEIILVDVETRAKKIVIDDLEDAHAVDYLFGAGIVIWIDGDSNSINRAPITKGQDITNIISTDTIFPNAIAVDWIYAHIYWSDSVKRTIEVTNLLGNMRKIIIRYTTGNPQSIAVNPLEGWLFCSVANENPRIERCGMDGTHCKQINPKKISQPDSLTIDFDQKRIYWMDTQLKIISSANFDGSNYAFIVAVDDTFLSSVAVYKDWLYWTKWIPGIIFKGDKYNATNITKVIGDEEYPEHILTMSSIRVYHSDKQPAGWNYCGPNNGNCSHFCFPSPRLTNNSLGYTCDCPVGYILKDGRSCHMNKTVSVCDPPRLPGNSRITPVSEKYFHKQHVKIFCDEGFVLFGSDTLICNNGVWNEITFFCDNNLLYKQNISISNNDVKFTPCQEKLTDGDPSTCLSENVTSKTSLVLDLQAISIIQNITLTMHFPDTRLMEHDLNLMFEVANHSGSSKCIFCNSTTKGRWNNNTGELTYSGNTVAGRLLKISFIVVRDLPINIELCELNIFSINMLSFDTFMHNHSSRACKFMEKSRNCIVKEMIDSNGNQFILYSPKDGYHLKGRTLRKCENGQWMNDPPQCYNISTFPNSANHSLNTTVHLSIGPTVHHLGTVTPSNETNITTFSNSDKSSLNKSVHDTLQIVRQKDHTYKIAFITLSASLAMLFVAFILYKFYFKRNPRRTDKVSTRKREVNSSNITDSAHLINDSDDYNKEAGENSENIYPL